MEILNIKLTENEVKRLLFALSILSDEDNSSVRDSVEVIGLGYRDFQDNLKNLIDVVQIQLPKDDSYVAITDSGF